VGEGDDAVDVRVVGERVVLGSGRRRKASATRVATVAEQFTEVRMPT